MQTTSLQESSFHLKSQLLIKRQKRDICWGQLAKGASAVLLWLATRPEPLIIASRRVGIRPRDQILRSDHRNWRTAVDEDFAAVYTVHAGCECLFVGTGRFILE